MTKAPDLTSSTHYFQEGMQHNNCFGCGKENGQSLQVRSRWDKDDSELAICEFEPAPHQSAYAHDVVYGGLIAGVIDCHSICTAIADAYRRAGRAIGEGEAIVYATGSLQVEYKKPTPISMPFRVEARVAETHARRSRVESVVYSQGGETMAEGVVMAISVPSSWADPSGLFGES